MKYTLLTCGLLMSMSAFADTRASGDGLLALDTDGDHMISLPEAQASAPELASRFTEIDTNHDGLLSIDEVIAGRPTRNVRFARSMPDDFAAADTNADGMLTPAEAAAMPIVSDFFGEIDSNADGHVTQDEIREHARTHGPVRVFKDGGPETSKQ